MELSARQRPKSWMLIAMCCTENGFGIILHAVMSEHPTPRCPEVVFLEKSGLPNRFELLDGAPHRTRVGDVPQTDIWSPMIR